MIYNNYQTYILTCFFVPFESVNPFSHDRLFTHLVGQYLNQWIHEVLFGFVQPTLKISNISMQTDCCLP